MIRALVLGTVVSLIVVPLVVPVIILGGWVGCVDYFWGRR